MARTIEEIGQMARNRFNGSGWAFTLLINDEPVAFKTVLVDVPDPYHFEDKDARKLVLMHVAENGMVMDGSLYSGGATGYGTHTQELKKLEDGMHIVEHDPIRIREMLVAKEIEEHQLEVRRNAAIEEAVEALNNEPAESVFHKIDNVEFILVKGQATYQPAMSAKVNVAFMTRVRDKEGALQAFDAMDFITSNGNLRWDKAVSAMTLVLQRRVGRKECQKMINDLRDAETAARLRLMKPIADARNTK